MPIAVCPLEPQSQQTPEPRPRSKFHRLEFAIHIQTEACGIPPRIMPPLFWHRSVQLVRAAGSLWCEHAGGLVQPLAPGSGDRECAVPMAES